MHEFINEQAFRDLCDGAWTEAERELREPCNKFALAVPVLFAIKNRLCDFLGVRDEIEGVYRLQDTPSGAGLSAAHHETFSQAYMRRIGEIITGRMRPTFDYVQIIKGYTQRADAEYGDAPLTRSSPRGRKKRSVKKARPK